VCLGTAWRDGGWGWGWGWEANGECDGKRCRDEARGV